MRGKVIFLSLALALFSSQGAVQVVYRGRLSVRSGAAVTSAHDVSFKLYPSESGGSAVWGMKVRVTPDGNGNIQVALADGLAADVATYLVPGSSLTNVLQSGKAKYLGVTVGKALEIAPRQALLPQPRALAAHVAKRIAPNSVIESLSGSSLTAAKAKIDGSVSVTRSLTCTNAAKGTPFKLATSSPESIRVAKGAFSLWGDWNSILPELPKEEGDGSYTAPTSGVYWVTTLHSLPQSYEGFALSLVIPQAAELNWCTPGLIFFGTAGTTYLSHPNPGKGNLEGYYYRPYGRQ